MPKTTKPTVQRTKPPSLYTKYIQEDAGVNPHDAHLIENLMRNTYGTLDNLDKETFKETAQAAKLALEKRGVRKLVEAEVFGS
jgi:hypothetical protein